MTHHIDPGVLRKAAEQLLAIDEAGYGIHLDRELQYAISDGVRQRESTIRFHLSLAGNEVDSFATRLATITDCPVDQAHGVALDLLGYGERRAVGLKVLADVSRDVRRHGRRSA